MKFFPSNSSGRFDLTWSACLKLFTLYLFIRGWKTIFGGLWTLLTSFRPLLVGCAIAYLLNILMEFYERRCFSSLTMLRAQGIRRFLALLTALGTLALLITWILTLVIPQVSACIRTVFDRLPETIPRLIHLLKAGHLLPEFLTSYLSGIDWNEKINDFTAILSSQLGGTMDLIMNTASSIVSRSAGIVRSFIFAFYLLLSKETLFRQCRRIMRHYLDPVWYARIRYVLPILNTSFHHFIVGQCMEACILGVLCLLGMLLLHLPYPIALSAFVMVTSLLPAGKWIGSFLGAFVVFMESPRQALIFLLFLLGLHQLESNVIYPRIVGLSIHLPPIWVLAAVTVGSGTMGILGIFLAVPIAAAVYHLIQHDLNTSCPSDNP